MRIIGSSKIDDYKKAALEETVLRAINAKPGDSVLFYRRQNGSEVYISKAEGAYMTSEADAPIRNHMRGVFEQVRYLLIIDIILVALSLFMVAINFSSFDLMSLAVTVILMILAIAAVAFTIVLSRIVDTPYETNTLVTIGGPFEKNRLVGLTRLSTDGLVITGDLYISTLFGSNPTTVDVTVDLENGQSIEAISKRVRFAPGYALYKIRFKAPEITDGTLTLVMTYNYIGKSIVVTSPFDMKVAEGGKELVVSEKATTATFEFDESLNSVEFDDALFESEDETGAI